MNMIEAVTVCFKKYATGAGRASRSEYWYFYLFLLIGGFVATFLDVKFCHFDPKVDSSFKATPITLLFQLVTLVPSIAVSIRRLHDVSRGWKWLLIGFTLVGLIFPLFYWYCKEGTKGDNQFGADPLGRESNQLP